LHEDLNRVIDRSQYFSGVDCNGKEDDQIAKEV
jgi:hypothetical protein